MTPFPNSAGTSTRSEVGAFLGALLLYGLFYATFFIQSFRSGNLLAPSDSFDYGVADYLSPVALWTDSMFSGFPFGADPQSFIWHPLLQACRLVGIDWNIFLIAAYAIGAERVILYVNGRAGLSIHHIRHPLAAAQGAGILGAALLGRNVACKIGRAHV
mgnify:CR=1 FL=1